MLRALREQHEFERHPTRIGQSATPAEACDATGSAEERAESQYPRAVSPEEAGIWQSRTASYSPVTPTSSEEALPIQESTDPNSKSTPEFIDTPEAPPVNLDENTDAIALRAALSILQLQRQQGLRDIRDLEKMKAAAIKDPDGFVEHLKASKNTTAQRDGVEVDVDDDEDSENDDSAEERSESKFPKFPAAQNVVRAPPIEWAKYGVVGAALGQPPQDPHQIAAPYKHFVDRNNAPQK
ncbi:uncharacterized protein AB675_6670 [Cyphellophora attinorum]|uniref:Uncharacterized protein n=1 Tax=Cyphellophora attinorum TaxID=1664694 RepID=A0A0N1H8W5_9EURO|nr:uncharacterized protein AB675_6670 [Phialophora attinorum]KPI43613.1 hypothetical protein AB675_6670 [Phialophora attinorum]